MYIARLICHRLSERLGVSILHRRGKTCAEMRGAREETRNHGRHTCHRLFTLTIPSELCLPATRRYITADRSIAVLRNTRLIVPSSPRLLPLFFSFLSSFLLLLLLSHPKRNYDRNPRLDTTPDTTIPPLLFLPPSPRVNDRAIISR